MRKIKEKIFSFSTNHYSPEVYAYKIKNGYIVNTQKNSPYERNDEYMETKQEVKDKVSEVIDMYL